MTWIVNIHGSFTHVYTCPLFSDPCYPTLPEAVEASGVGISGMVALETLGVTASGVATSGVA